MTPDIRAWLDQLGFARFAEAFIENGVDYDLLPQVTNDDLKDLGVVRLADRKRLLNAIADLEGVARYTEPKVESRYRSAAAVAVEAERRQLTVMFCDLVGSTELSRRLDPEELREVMRRYQDAVVGAVNRHGGHVAKYLGDGVLAYFGWPQAHEHQAERAVRAGLDAAAAVSNLKLDGGIALQARAGIATGQVIVGDLIGEVGRDTDAVVGETPNLAARLQGVAGPGQVVIGALTRQLIGQAYVLADLGARTLKGFLEPVPAWRVAGESAVESRFEAAHGHALTRFVGRRHELGLMADRWRLATDGAGQVVLLAGEAGIGKSRLVRALRQQIGDSAHFRLRYQCSPHHANDALRPIVQRLEQAAGFTTEDTAESKLDKLEAMLRISEDDIEAVAPLFAALLSLPSDDRYGALELTPQQRRDRTIAAMVGQVLALSRRRPVLFVLEDAHWIDPSTESLVGEIMTRIADQAVFMLITHRPGYLPPWAGQPHLSSVALNRLSRDHGAEIVAAAGGGGLAAGVVDRVLARADGVPLYVEELTKSLLESVEQDVPATLQASLQARLDRLGAAKEIAQIGAVIGREFSQPLLAAVAGASETELAAALDVLTGSGLVFRAGTPPSVTFSFKHALVQDAAYDSLLRDRRRNLHRRIGEALLAAQAADGDEMAAILAHHFVQAEDDRGLEHLTRAAARARRLYAHDEAIQFFGTAIELLGEEPGSKSARAAKVDLLTQQAAVTYIVGRYQDCLPLYRTALDLAAVLEDTRTLARVHDRLGRTHYMVGNMDEAIVHHQKAIDLFGETGDDAGFARAHLDLGTVYFTCRTLPEAIHCHRTALKIAERSGDRRGQAAALTVLSNTLCRAGEVDDSIDCVTRALKIADELGDERRLAWASVIRAQAFSIFGTGEVERILEPIEMAERLFDTLGDYYGKNWVINIRAQAAWLRGDLEQALEGYRRFLDLAIKSGGSPHETASNFACMADVYMELGHIREARDACEQARSLAAGISLRLEDGYALAVLAEVYASDTYRDHDKAEASYSDAVAALEAVGGSDIGRAHLAGARIARTRGKRDLARDRARQAQQILKAHKRGYYLRQADALLDELA